MKSSQKIEMDQSLKNQDERPPSSEPWFAILVDIRVLVFLLSIGVVTMTVTVSMSSRESKQVAVDQLDFDDRSGIPLSNDVSPHSVSGGQPEKNIPNSGDQVVEPGPPVIKQSTHGTFEIPTEIAVLSEGGLESNSSGIANWQVGDFAQWTLAVSQRRKGFFYCNITYQAKLECQFSVQLGQLAPRRFSIYPKNEDFTEQFIVRLDKRDEQNLKLIAEKIETTAGVQIKGFTLVPK